MSKNINCLEGLKCPKWRKTMDKRLYYHKTDGGAEYLTDRWTRNPDGSKEGVFKNARIIVRIDGDIRKDAKITLADELFATNAERE